MVLVKRLPLVLKALEATQLLIRRVSSENQEVTQCQDGHH